MYHIIYNPTARKGKSKKVLKQIEEFFNSEHVEYKLYKTDRKGCAEELANRLSASEENILVAVGGDGTIHEVLNGLQDPKKTKLCLIPAGTGNDFCAAAGIGLDVKKTLQILLHGEAKETDYIEAFGRRCMNAGGLGIDVDVLERCARGSLNGKIKYLVSFIQSVILFRGYKVRIKINGEEFEENALFAQACNGHRIGGGIVVCPGAKIDDGKLEVVAVPRLGFFALIATFIAVMQGKIFSRPEAKHFYGEEVEIIPDVPRCVQLDGEIYQNCTSFKAKICHGLRIYR